MDNLGIIKNISEWHELIGKVGIGYAKAEMLYNHIGDLLAVVKSDSEDITKLKNRVDELECILKTGGR